MIGAGNIIKVKGKAKSLQLNTEENLSQDNVENPSEDSMVKQDSTILVQDCPFPFQRSSCRANFPRKARLCERLKRRDNTDGTYLSKA